MLLAVLMFFLLPLPLSAAAALPHHDISVSLDPDSHQITVHDVITLPPEFPDAVTFGLHAGLNPQPADPAIRIEKVSTRTESVPLEVFRVFLPAGSRQFSLNYGGAISHPLESSGMNQARGFDQTAGSISPEGVYLSAASAWYPLLEADFITFTLTVQAPPGWDAVSQGARTAHQALPAAAKVSWDSPEPQQEIFLIASRFSEYEKKAPGVTAQVFLRSPDKGLAEKYLDATVRYISMYDGLIGPYPYRKFALVENFWETGFGMPSFTLLGPTVLRLPFIINTSYPHEILHNWWGNSVYPDYASGNWSEGITAYMADHLLREQQGEGADYRLSTLQKYADYVSSGRDFPLKQFTARHSPSTEAVGYGKALMFFHMLRLELGDKTFIEGFRSFYKTYKFHVATFADIEKSLEAASGKNLRKEFEQWVTKTGSPEIRLRNAAAAKHGDGYVAKALLQQVQPGEAYRLRIPIAVTVEGQEKAVQTVVEMNSKKQDISIAVPARPLRIDIDPEFDVFRRLDRAEIPPAISQALGARKMLVVLPSSAAPDLLKAYRQFAEALSASGPDRTAIKLDTDIKALPSDGSAAILGWENRFADRILSELKGYPVSPGKSSVTLGTGTIPRDDHSFVLTARNPQSRDEAVMFIAADRPQSLPGLGRKLPHYHKYSYLAFEGEEPANVAKGRWPVVDSPLTAFLSEGKGRLPHVAMAKLAPREALAALPPLYSAERMMETVNFLASERIRGREIGTAQIDQAADFVAGLFMRAGLAPGGDNGQYFQNWKDPARGIEMRNVIGILPGKKPEFAGQSVVLGAHYDHLGTGMSIGRTEDRGKIHPGADDNASGVAVLSEVAVAMQEAGQPERSIVFVAFTGEEEGKLGSLHYVQSEKQYPVSKCIGMVNLDTVGRLAGKKLFVLGGSSAKEWVHIFRGAGYVTGVDVDMVSEDLDSSDQISFQQAGVPAVQLFSGPHPDYHRPGDTPDKIDPAGLVKVASVTREVVEYLAARPQPLTSALKPGQTAEQTGSKTERRVSLGTIPDYGYKGKGVRLSGTVERSPAAVAGMKAGDVITKLNGRPVGSLKDFSDLLKKLKPGDKASVGFLRDGKEMQIETAVAGR